MLRISFILCALCLTTGAMSQNITLPGSTLGTLVPIGISYSGASGAGNSWIGLYRAESADGNWITYQYIHEKEEGTLDFDGREETGLFNFRLFRGGGYDKIGTSATFMIRQAVLPDLTFQDGGKFRRDLLANSLDDWAVAVRTTKDDMIVVAGTAKTGMSDSGGYEKNEFVVMRFKPSGELDETFGTDGIVRADFSLLYQNTHLIAAKEARAVVVQDDGRIIVGGNGSVNWDGARFQAVIMARFDVNGSPDESFGDRGVVVRNFLWPDETLGYAWDDLRCLELDGQGRILAGGGSLLSVSYSPGRPFIGRFTSTGSLDLTFGGIGMVTHNDSIEFRGFVESIIPPPAGSEGTILAGITAQSMFGMNKSIVLKINDNGNQVPDFGVNGVVVERRPGVTNGQTLKSIGLSPNGNLILMGHSAGWAIWLAGKSEADGSDKAGFGQDGIGYFDPTPYGDIPGGMIMTPDNRILIGSITKGSNWSIVCFAPDGNVKPDFGASFHSLVTSGNQPESFVTGIAMQSNGNYVLVGGTRYAGISHYDLMILRFKDNPEMLSGTGKMDHNPVQLLQNYPNPFSNSTTISWMQDREAHISLVIYDMLGSPVASLVNEIRQAGEHRIAMDPANAGTGKLPAGLYIYRIIIQPTGAGNSTFTETRKMTILPER